MATTKKASSKKSAKTDAAETEPKKAGVKKAASTKAAPKKKAAEVKEVKTVKAKAVKDAGEKEATPKKKAAAPKKKAPEAPAEPEVKAAKTAKKSAKAEKAEKAADAGESAKAKKSGEKVPPVKNAAHKAAEKLGIGADELDRTVERLRGLPQDLQAKAADAINLLYDDFRTGLKKVESMAGGAAKNMGLDTAELGKNLDKLGEKAVDAAVTAGAEAKKGIARARQKLESIRTKYKK